MNQAPEPSPTYAVIVAAGRGSRMKGGGPKQYQLLGEKTVLAHTLSAFLECDCIDGVLTVIHRDDRTSYDDSINSLDGAKLLEPAIGGNTRQQSVFEGLKALSETVGKDGKVLIHDAARPFVSSDLISSISDAVASDAGALPALPIVDTIKRVSTDSLVERTVSRDGLYLAQTPQGFMLDTLLAAHERAAKANNSEFTDDASIAEWAGLRVQLITGDKGNFKITTPQDMSEAKMKLHAEAIPDLRTGHGYDTHAFVAGDKVRLCGIDIAHHAKLDGHSDADVGLHALTDALLATVAEGDIGSHFPPSDPKWKDADSEQFFKHAIDRVAVHGGVVTHLDVTLVCEQPKIGPHRDAMRQRIADISGIDAARISVKATTNEKMGFIGREEGMVAHATASAFFGYKNDLS